MAGIVKIIIITTADDLPSFKKLLGTGKNLGLDISYAVQDAPNGIAEAYLIAEEFLDGNASALILGDNIFFGNKIKDQIKKVSRNLEKNTILTHHVANPQRYGVVSFDHDGKIKDIKEKPLHPSSSFAVTGFYFLDAKACQYAKSLTYSSRNELEISDLLKIYLEKKALSELRLGRGSVWFDAGTVDSLLEASNFVQTIRHRQNLLISCPEEIAFQEGLISVQQLIVLAENQKNQSIKNYLLEIVSKVNKHEI